MEVLVCENNSSGTRFLLMVTDCPWKIFMGINIARQRVWENHLRGTKSPDKVQGCLEKTLWTNYWETNSVKTCTMSSKKETTALFANRCSFDQRKGKVVHTKQVWIGWNHIKAATCYSGNSFTKVRSHQQQLASSSYQRTQPMVEFLLNLLTITIQCSFLSKLNNFSLCRKQCAAGTKPKFHFMILQT